MFGPYLKVNTAGLHYKAQFVKLFKESHTKQSYVATLCGQNAQLLIVRACRTYNYHWALKSLI
jgi:hypothetical protein